MDIFSTSPNPTQLYITPSLEAILYTTQNVIAKRRGLSVLLADIGLGKSTILRYLYASVSSNEKNLATLIPTPQFTSLYALMRYISDDFGVPVKRSLIAQQSALEEFLADQYKQGKNVVLFIDESQLLRDDILEGIRGLLNFETNTAKLVQIVLAGQLELKFRLDQEKHKPLKSRIHSYGVINPLTDIELEAMLDFRCKQGSKPNPFKNDVLQTLYEESKGNPRNALKIADVAVGYAELAKSKLTAEMVVAASQDTGVKDV